MDYSSKNVVEIAEACWIIKLVNSLYKFVSKNSLYTLVDKSMNHRFVMVHTH